MIDASTIALLVKAATTTIDEAASLIEKFAEMRSAEACVRAAEDAHARILLSLDGPIRRVQ